VSNEWTVQDQGAAAIALSRIYGFPISLTSKAAGLATIANAFKENDLPKAQVAALLLKFPDPLFGNPSRNERQALADSLARSALLDAGQFASRTPSGGSAGVDCNVRAENELLKDGFDPNQPRDGHGRWTYAGGSSDSSGQDRHVTDVAYQGEYHDSLAQHEIEQYRQAGARCISEARLALGFNTARIDILCRSKAGDLLGAEIKTGDDPRLTFDQVAVYSHSLLGGLTSPDSKISQLGFSPGELLPPFPVFIVYAQGPGAPKRFFGPIK
jgi:hypothetical protein